MTNGPRSSLSPRRFFPGRFILTLLGLVALVSAGRAADSSIKTFDLPADSADKALRQFSAQSGIQVIFPTETVKGVMTLAVKGEMTAHQALDQMLEGTVLVGVEDPKTGALTVRREASPEKAAKNVNRAIAQDSGRPDRNAKTDVDANGEPVVKLDTFEVFAKKTLNMDIRRTQDDVQPFVVFGQDELRKSGATNIYDFFRGRLTAASQTSFTNLGTRSPTNSFPTIALRGLSGSQTLILVDGRRLAGGYQSVSGVNQPDLSAIPVSAIERIEVLPSTASGIYGGSALGGVINIIMRRDYTGVDITVTYGNAFDTDAATRQAELSGGFALENGRTNVMFTAKWSDGTNLLSQDRAELRRRIIDLTLANIPTSSTSSIYGATTPILGATTNISSVSVGGVKPNLTLKGGGSLNSPFTSVPYGYGGPASDNGAGLIARAGQYNFDLANYASELSALYPIRYTPTQSAYSASVRREMAPRLTLFAEGMYTKTTATIPVTAQAASFTLQPNDIGNPFNEAIRVTTPPLGTAVGNNTATRQLARVGVGAILQLPHNWKTEADLTWNESRFEGKTESVLLTAAALPGVVGGSLNVFRDPNQFGIDWTPYLDRISNSSVYFPTKSQTKVGTIRASGPVDFAHFLSDATLSTALEYRKDELGDFRSTFGSTTQLTPARSQDNSSFYAELHWPLVGKQAKAPFIRSLELLAAGRIDSFDTNASTTALTLDSNGNPTKPIIRAHSRRQSTNPTFALTYEPAEDLMLRASFGTGFLPPSVFQITPSAPSTTTFSAAAGLMDTARGNEPVVGTYTIANSGGNPNLRPETSTSWSVGLVGKPQIIPGLRLSIDWTKIDKENNITAPFLISSQPLFADFLSQFPDRVLRGPPSGGFSMGPITGFDTSNINALWLKIEAIDYTIEYVRPTSFGKFTFRARATNNRKSLTRLATIAPTTDQLDTAQALKWSAVSTIAWERGNWSAAWTGYWYPSFFVSADHSINAVLGSSRLDAQNYHDLFVGYRFGAERRALLRNVDISVTVRNVFNREGPPDPAGQLPFTTNLGGADPILANYSIAIRKSF